MRLIYPDDDSEPEPEGTLGLRLHGADYYYVFPSYGAEFRDMSAWRSNFLTAFRGTHRFWPGFSGGGVLAAPLDMPPRKRNSLALATARCHHKPIYGLVLGNEAARKLADCLSCAIPERAPAFAVRMGLAERVPDPTVAATAEHIDGLGGARYLLVVPKANRRAVKMMDRLPEWFASFGVSLGADVAELPEETREGMRDWFGDPDRPMFAFPMSGGEPNAAWQLAVTYYIAEYWDIHARGLDTLHVVAEIDGRPSFRRNWTSRK